MSPVSRFEGNVQVGTDMEFEKRWWRFQHMMWIVMILLILGGFLGLFGRGPLNRASAAVSGVPMSIEYERVMRYETPGQITLFLSNEAIQPVWRELRIWVNQPLMDTIKIEQTIPRPSRVESLGDGSIFSFSTAPGSGWARIVFRQQCPKEGQIKGEIALIGKPPLHLKQIVLP